MSNKVRIPRTKTECFEILDEMLSQEVVGNPSTDK